MVDGILYQFGGFDSLKSCCTPTERSYKYDPGTDTWTAIADLPFLAGNGGAGTGVTHAGVTTDGEDVFLAGGYISANGSSGQTFGTVEVYRYDVSADTYERLPDLPAARASGALEYLDGKLHFVSGTNLARTDEPTTHYVLDLVGSATSWTTAAPVPLGRNHPGSAVLDGELYFIAGQTGHDGPSVAHDEVFVYDPTLDAWSEVASIPAAVNHIASSTFVLDGRIVVAGGKPSHTTNTATVWAYTPGTDSWAALTSLPSARSSGVAGALGSQWLYTGGSGAGTAGVLASPVGLLYEYDFEAWTVGDTFDDYVPSGWSSTSTWEVAAPDGNKILFPNAGQDTLTFDAATDDVTASAWFYSHPFSSLGGPVARLLDQDNFLLAEAVKGDGLKLYIRQGGTFTQLQPTYSELFPEGTAYRIDLTVAGDDVSVALDGVEVITHTLSGTETLGQRVGVFSEVFSYIDRMSASTLP